MAVTPVTLAADGRNTALPSASEPVWLTPRWRWSFSSAVAVAVLK